MTHTSLIYCAPDPKQNFANSLFLFSLYLLRSRPFTTVNNLDVTPIETQRNFYKYYF